MKTKENKTKIKKNDLVKVMTGKDKGKTGKIIQVLKKQNRVLVEGVAFVKKHKKVEKGEKGTQKGGIETMESPIHISNVMLVLDSEKKITTRTGIRITENKKIRYSKKTGKEI